MGADRDLFLIHIFHDPLFTAITQPLEIIKASKIGQNDFPAIWTLEFYREIRHVSEIILKYDYKFIKK